MLEVDSEVDLLHGTANLEAWVASGRSLRGLRFAGGKVQNAFVPKRGQQSFKLRPETVRFLEREGEQRRWEEGRRGKIMMTSESKEGWYSICRHLFSYRFGSLYRSRK